MEPNTDSQGEESSYHDAPYYEGLDGSLQDQDPDYQGCDMKQRSPLREQDRFLPIANVAKIMKRAVPGNGKIAKDAKECVQECVSEFISFITSEAAERCQTEKRKTINGEDLLCAMNALGFDNYVEPLKAFLVKFRETSKLEPPYMDESVVNTSLSPTVPSTVGSTVILTPTMLTTNPANLTTLPSRSIAGRQFTIVNGSGDLTTSTIAVSVPNANAEIKLSNATMATLGTPVSTSLGGTTFILPISPQLALVTSAANTATTSEQPADSAS